MPWWQLAVSCGHFSFRFVLTQTVNAEVNKPQCWPGYELAQPGDLHVDALRMGPGVIVGTEGPAKNVCAVGTLVVEANTTALLAFPGTGTYVTYRSLQVCVSSHIWRFVF
jgi:hypothetical protein